MWMMSRRSGTKGAGSIRRAVGVLAAALLLPGALGACGTSPAQGSGTTLTHVTIAMGYFPNIQFAPFYVAQSKGYYRKAGLNVTFRSGIEPDMVALLTSGKVQFANVGGDEVLEAGAQGRPVRYVMTQYSRFPTAVFSLAATGIRRASDLRGHSIGVPGTYGASYVGLLALLDAVHLSTSDVAIKTIGFSQAQTLAAHKVDAAVGYATNDVVQLTARGTAVNEIDVYRYANLASAGVVTTNAEIRQHPALVRAFVAATLHGLRDTIAHPAAAYRVSVQAVKEIGAQPAVQRAVLRRTIDFWKPEPGHPLGWVNPAIWSRTARVLYQFHQIPRPVQAARYYTERFVPGR
jgi:NitT/TauT family transport system substrate-binding protein